MFRTEVASNRPRFPVRVHGAEMEESAPELDLSIVIPVYNSAATLRNLIEQLTATLDGLGERYEIILIDDGSADESWATLQALREEYAQLVVVQLMRNYGQHNTLMCGLGLARGAYIVTMDDDLQNPPSEIPKMLAHIRQSDLDLVYGTPEKRKHAPWRNIGATTVLQFYRIVFRNPISPTPFRVMRHQLARNVLFYDLNFTYLDGLLAWCTQRIGSVEVAHHPRGHGVSGYSMRKLIGLALNLYTNFSLIPLQVVSALGVLAAASGFLAGLYYLVQFLASSIAIPGYASTIIAILMLGGVQLLALGVLGEYLGRLHLNVNRKPQYVVRSIESGPSPSLAASPDAPAEDSVCA